jgi:hypothetical protein
MNQREKVLASVVGGAAGLIFLIIGVRQIITLPLKEIDKRTAAAREKISKIQADRRAFFAAEDRLKKFAGSTFAETTEEASALSGELLTRQIAAAGLRESDFTRLPLGPRRLNGASEIGWSLQGDGALTNVINLLYLLNESPWLHRTDDLTVVPGDSPGRVRVRVRYLTLVMEPALDATRANFPSPKLDSPNRRFLDGIVARDLLRPYIKSPPPPPPTAAATAKRETAAGPENFRVVSLSEWEGQPEVHVRDQAGRKTLHYRPGDQVAGGAMVMVDYRPMPLPGNSQLQSFSRLILKINEEYWAVERGATFADKHKLTTAELPASLAGRP